MVADDEDAHAITCDSIEEVIGKAFEVGPPEVGFENVVSVRLTGSVQQESTQFAIEVLGQFRLLGPLIIVHDLIHIGTDTPMQDEPHDFRRCCMCESMSRRLIA